MTTIYHVLEYNIIGFLPLINILIVLVALISLRFKRLPHLTTAIWVCLIIFLPVVGGVIYFLFWAFKKENRDIM